MNIPALCDTVYLTLVQMLRCKVTMTRNPIIRHFSTPSIFYRMFDMLSHCPNCPTLARVGQMGQLGQLGHDCRRTISRRIVGRRPRCRVISGRVSAFLAVVSVPVQSVWQVQPELW